MIDSIDHIEWLESLTRQVTGLEQYCQRVEPMLAPEFNVLRYARTDEYGLSLILADLLNPHGPHGQGDRFLRCFLHRYWSTEPQSSFAIEADVRTEVATHRIEQTQGRIDIQVALPGRILAIENKPWAADQPRQIERYLDQLRKSGRRIRLLYLTGRDAQQPSDFSVDRDLLQKARDAGEFLSTTYLDLRDWLRDCRGVCENERVTTFLRDFERYIGYTFAGDRGDSTSQLIANVSLGSPADSRSAAFWSKAADGVRLSLLERLEGQLRSAFANRTDGWKLRIVRRLDRAGLSATEEAHSGIDIFRRSDSAIRIRFAFDYKRCQGFYYGVCGYRKEDSTRYPMLKTRLQQTVAGGLAKIYPNWIWLEEFPKLNWWYRTDAWQDIESGITAGTIISRAEELMTVIDGDEALRELFDRASDTVPPDFTSPPDSNSYPRDPAADQLLQRCRMTANAPAAIDVSLKVQSAWFSGVLSALANRLAGSIENTVRADPRFKGWHMRRHDNLTDIYAGIFLWSDHTHGLEVGLEFQSYNCGAAIFGVYSSSDGIKGLSTEGEALHAALVAAGLGRARRSEGWIWYAPCDPANWFDDVDRFPEMTGGVLEKSVVESLAKAVLATESLPSKTL